jgi:hypothetical protein
MLKTVSSITNAIGALNYKGTWNASANSPALASSVGSKGDYYVVSTAGATILNGISNWGVGDWAAFNGSVWQRVEGGADLNGVNLTVTGTSLLGTSIAPAYGGVVRVGGGAELHNSQQINIAASNALANFEWVQRVGQGIDFYITNATVLASLSAAGIWTNASDARYKENIRPVNYGLAEIMQLQPRAYNMIDSKQEQIGFVAQEVQSILPELVETKTNSITDEERMTLSYGQMSAVLVKAIQELKTELDQVKSELQTLKGN